MKEVNKTNKLRKNYEKREKGDKMTYNFAFWKLI